MKTSLRFKFRNLDSHTGLAWASTAAFLLAVAGGVSSLAVGCHNQASDKTEVSPEPSGNQPSLVNSPAREPAAKAATIAQAVSPAMPAANANANVATPNAVVTEATSPSAKPTASTAPVEVALQPAKLQVKRFVVTPGVKEREPLATGATLTLGEPIYAFTELVSGAGAAAPVEIVFEHESGRKVGHIKLDVPPSMPRWRTWGQTRGVNKAGRWTAVLLDADQAEIGRVAFEVSAKTPTDAVTAAVPTSAPQALLAE